VERDAALLGSVAACIESLPSPAGGRLVATELVDAVEEFMSRIFGELDYRNEMANAATFAGLYSYRHGSCKNVKVVVPEMLPELCTDDVLVMEWLDGTKLTSIHNVSSDDLATNIVLIETGIECTLSQLLDTGVLHADPHGGNLLRVELPEGPRLGYLDFGLLSTVPSQVRDGLVCAVAQLVIARDVEAVANLFGEPGLLPQEVLLDPAERAALTEALDKTLADALVSGETSASLSVSAATLLYQQCSCFEHVGRHCEKFESKFQHSTGHVPVLFESSPHESKKVAYRGRHLTVLDSITRDWTRRSKACLKASFGFGFVDRISTTARAVGYSFN
jgi:predicted unusual protein kinase regulating ubiquinone biosynthesis (AarF/ABC1/UbiB family)